MKSLTFRIVLISIIHFPLRGACSNPVHWISARDRFVTLASIQRICIFCLFEHILQVNDRFPCRQHRLLRFRSFSRFVFCPSATSSSSSSDSSVPETSRGGLSPTTINQHLRLLLRRRGRTNQQLGSPLLAGDRHLLVLECTVRLCLRLAGSQAA